MAAAKGKADAPDAQAPGAVVDRVAMVSYRADGTPDQTPGFVVLVDDQDDRTVQSGS